VTAQPSGTERYEHSTVRSRRAAAKAWRQQYAHSHPDDPRHGTLSFYGEWGCRCPACRSAKSIARAAYAEAAIEARYHEATPYTVAEHRAFDEALCLACRRFLRFFEG
jgi:hypothetical protein